VDLAVAGYRRHVRLEPEELDRLASVISARSLVFDIWRLQHGSRAATDAARAAADTARLATQTAARARAALSA
jgi:Ser/Thr protein kinase RdoA (MazF antagonist)